jgi:hypothetical protein
MSRTHLDNLFYLEQDILQAWGVRREEDSSATYDQQRVTNIVCPASEDTGPSGV